MRGTGDGEKFGQALHDTEDDGLEDEVHEVRRQKAVGTRQSSSFFHLGESLNNATAYLLRVRYSFRISNAACALLYLFSKRFPVQTNRLVHAASSAASAMYVSPSGLVAVAPPGPIMPVTPTAISARNFCRACWAITIVTGSLTAPCCKSNSCGTSSNNSFASYA